MNYGKIEEAEGQKNETMGGEAQGTGDKLPNLLLYFLIDLLDHKILFNLKIESIQESYQSFFNHVILPVIDSYN